MSKFTKGPWRLKSFNDNPEKGWTLYANSNEDGEEFVVCQRPAIEGEEYGANARLIAAAPDMYYLLRTLCDELLIEFEHRSLGDLPLSYSRIADLLDRIDGEQEDKS